MDAIGAIWGMLSPSKFKAQKGEFKLSEVARENILQLQPYRCARDDYSEGILLDANENSIGPAVATHPHLALNRYPDPLHMDLKAEIAQLRKVDARQIFLGVGSDEAIDILFRIFCNPRVDNVVVTPPTYGMYKVCAKVNDVAVKSAPLTPEFDLDVPATLAAIDAHTKIIFLCSPGNPTSKIIPCAAVEEILYSYTSGVVVVDEAYIDFRCCRQSVVSCPLVCFLTLDITHTHTSACLFLSSIARHLTLTSHPTCLATPRAPAHW